MNDERPVFHVGHLIVVLSILSLTGIGTSLYFASLLASMSESSMHLKDECISRATANSILEVAERASRISNLCIDFQQQQQTALKRSFPVVFGPMDAYPDVSYSRRNLK